MTTDWSGAERKTHLAPGQGANLSRRKKLCQKEDLTAAQGMLQLKSKMLVRFSHHIRMYQLC